MTAAVQPTLDQLMVDLARIHPNPDNVRHDLGDLDDLVDSIRSVGVIEPVILCEHPDIAGEWLTLAGHRRCAAGRLAGLDQVPAVVKDRPDDVTMIEVMLAENTHREGLDPIDEATALARIQASGKYSRLDQIAQRVHRSKEWVAGRLALLQLPESSWDDIRSGTVTLADAAAVASVKVGPEAKDVLLRHAANGNRRAIAEAIEEQRRIERDRELEREYGPLILPLEWHHVKAEHPWGVVELGDEPGQLNIPPGLHRSCDGHVAVRTPGGDARAWCTTPRSHSADFPADLDWPAVPTKAKPLAELGLSWMAREGHREHCPHHRVLDFPWATVEVCTDPTIHTNPARKGHVSDEELADARRADRGDQRPPTVAGRPRWDLDDAARTILQTRLTEALAGVPDEVLQVLHRLILDGTTHDNLFDAILDALCWDLREISAAPSDLEEWDVHTAAGIRWAFQATVDAGSAPETLEQIRTRLDVLTRGDDQDPDAVELEDGAP